MKRVFLLTVLITAYAAAVFAQESGKVQVVKDPQIDSLIARRAVLSRAANTPVAMGFRVQIFSSTDRKTAYAEQAKFKAAYPNIRSYVSYTVPYYKLRVGDFRTRLEAEKLINKLRSKYQGLFIFAERINPR